MEFKKTVLVTGGFGYIGVHIVDKLLSLDFKVVVVDNLCNVAEIPSEFKNHEDVNYYICDINNTKKLKVILNWHNVDSVIHLAALKSVGDSVKNPLSYYQNNVGGTVSLLNAMDSCGIHKIIFSSSSSVYGEGTGYDFVNEKNDTDPESPYAQSKLMCENILKDLCYSNGKWKAISLRYFNVVAGKYGDNGKSNKNLFPIIADCIENNEELKVFGNDYSTIDGSPVRDYIHMDDLVAGHIAALNYFSHPYCSFDVVNLGTGCGYSVLQIIQEIQNTCSINFKYTVEGRRDGDVGYIVAGYEKAKDLLGWEPTKTLSDICKDCFIS